MHPNQALAIAVEAELAVRRGDLGREAVLLRQAAAAVRNEPERGALLDIDNYQLALRQPRTSRSRPVSTS
jgi:hypothetical protein